MVFRLAGVWVTRGNGCEWGAISFSCAFLLLSESVGLWPASMQVFRVDVKWKSRRSIGLRSRPKRMFVATRTCVIIVRHFLSIVTNATVGIAGWH